MNYSDRKYGNCEESHIKQKNQMNFKGEARNQVHCAQLPAPSKRHLDQLLHTSLGTKSQEVAPKQTTQKPQTTRGEKQDLGPAVTANLRRKPNTDYIPSGWMRNRRWVRSLSSTKAGNQPPHQTSTMLCTPALSIHHPICSLQSVSDAS